MTQGVLSGDGRAVSAGLGNVARGDLNKPAAGLPKIQDPNKPAAVMPTVNQERVQKSRLSALQSLQSRTGRASTLLTSQGAGQNNTFG